MSKDIKYNIGIHAILDYADSIKNAITILNNHFMDNNKELYFSVVSLTSVRDGDTTKVLFVYDISSLI